MKLNKKLTAVAKMRCENAEGIKHTIDTIYGCIQESPKRKLAVINHLSFMPFIEKYLTFIVKNLSNPVLVSASVNTIESVIFLIHLLCEHDGEKDSENRMARQIELFKRTTMINCIVTLSTIGSNKVMISAFSALLSISFNYVDALIMLGHDKKLLSCLVACLDDKNLNVIASGFLANLSCVSDNCDMFFKSKGVLEGLLNVFSPNEASEADEKAQGGGEPPAAEAVAYDFDFSCNSLLILNRIAAQCCQLTLRRFIGLHDSALNILVRLLSVANSAEWVQVNVQCLYFLENLIGNEEKHSRGEDLSPIFSKLIRAPNFLSSLLRLLSFSGEVKNVVLNVLHDLTVDKGNAVVLFTQRSLIKAINSLLPTYPRVWSIMSSLSKTLICSPTLFYDPPYHIREVPQEVVHHLARMIFCHDHVQKRHDAALMKEKDDADERSDICPVCA